MFWSVNLCRICSHTSEMCLPIFDNSASLSIEVKIKRCLSAVITRDDMKPQQVCRQCVTKLNDLHNFINLFYDSNYKFENILYNYSLQHSNGSFPAQDCGELESLVNNQMPECSNINPNTLQLDNVDDRVLGTQQILNEIEQVGNILQAQTAVGNEQNSIKNCMSGNYYTLEPTPQKVFNRNTKPNLIFLPALISGTIRNDSLAPNVSKPRKSRNVRNNSEIGQFTCDKCCKVFSRKTRLTEHLLKHTSVRPFKCDQCDKSFAIKWDFTVHKRTHFSSNCCRYCSKCFSAPSKLLRHVRTHTNERPFICRIDNCDMAFSDRSNWVSHQRTHSNDRNFKCDICQQGYKSKSQLCDHMQGHSATSQYHCNTCGKAFKWKANLYSHNNQKRKCSDENKVVKCEAK